jgi:hypothetical protein
MTARKQLRRPLKAVHNGNVADASASSHPRKLQSDTDALKLKEQVERW